MKTRPIATLAAALALSGCMTIMRAAETFGPGIAVGAEASLAMHCVGAAQAGTPVDQRRQTRIEFGRIVYDMELRDHTTTARQKGVDDARVLNARRCPPLPDWTPPVAPVPVEPVPAEPAPG